MFFSLMLSQLFIIAFIAYAFGVIVKILLPKPVSRSFFPMFTSRIFMVPCLMFKSLIHLESVVVSSVRWRSNFVFLHVVIQHHLLKIIFSPQGYFWVPCQILVTIYTVVYFRNLFSVPLVYLSICMPVPYCFDYYIFVV